MKRTSMIRRKDHRASLGLSILSGVLAVLAAMQLVAPAPGAASGMAGAPAAAIWARAAR